MNAVLAHRSPGGMDSPYELAFSRALTDLANAQKEYETEKAQLAQTESRVVNLTQLAIQLLNLMPEERRAESAKRLENIRGGKSIEGRGGPVFDNVVRLFNKTSQSEWTVPSLKKELEREVGEVDAKSLHNVLDYLHRRGDIRRISRGVYRIVSRGVCVYSSDPALEHMTNWEVNPQD